MALLGGRIERLAGGNILRWLDDDRIVLSAPDEGCHAYYFDRDLRCTACDWRVVIGPDASVIEIMARGMNHDGDPSADGWTVRVRPEVRAELATEAWSRRNEFG